MSSKQREEIKRFETIVYLDTTNKVEDLCDRVIRKLNEVIERLNELSSPVKVGKGFTNLNDMKFVFAITDDWDDGRKELISTPMTLGDLIDNEDIEFTDGSGCGWKDINWETAEVKVKLQSMIKESK